MNSTLYFKIFLTNNVSASSTSTLTPSLRSSSMLVSIATLLSVIFVCGIVFNLISILTIIFSKAFQSINILILNLATADLIYISGIPIFITHIFGIDWPFGPTGCQIFFFTDFIGMIVGVWSIAALSLERYLDIVDKKKTLKSISAKTRKILVSSGLFFIWIFAICFTLPMIFSIKKENTTECESVWNEHQINLYFMLKFVFIFFLPFAVIMYCSVSIIKFLKRWRKCSLNRKLTREALLIMKKNRRSIRKASSLNAIKTNTAIQSEANVTVAKSSVSKQHALSICKDVSIKKSSLMFNKKLIKRINRRYTTQNPSSSHLTSSAFLGQQDDFNTVKLKHSCTLPVTKKELDNLVHLEIDFPTKKQILFLKTNQELNSSRSDLSNKNFTRPDDIVFERNRKRNFKKSLKKMIPSSYKSKVCSNCYF